MNSTRALVLGAVTPTRRSTNESQETKRLHPAEFGTNSASVTPAVPFAALEFKESLQHLPIRRRCMQFPKRQEKRRFWDGIRAGKSRAEAAVVAGVREQSGRRWFVQAGGVLPANVPAASSGRDLSMSGREEIFAGVERGESIRRIAEAMGRGPSTVLRELRRNMRHQLYRTRSPFSHRRTETWNYRPSAAQERMKRLALRPKTAKLAKNAQLSELVQAKLVEKLSPEQISRQL